MYSSIDRPVTNHMLHTSECCAPVTLLTDTCAFGTWLRRTLEKPKALHVCDIGRSDGLEFTWNRRKQGEGEG